MASDFTVAWQNSQREQLVCSLRIKLHASFIDALTNKVLSKNRIYAFFTGRQAIVSSVGSGSREHQPLHVSPQQLRYLGPFLEKIELWRSSNFELRWVVKLLKHFLLLAFFGSATPCASPPPWPPIFSDYSFWVHHLVNQDDRQLLAHAMASLARVFFK
jgi:hypothetical protein